MAKTPLVTQTQIEITATIPGVMVTLDLKQAALIRDVLSYLYKAQAKTAEETDLVASTQALFRSIGGMDVPRGRLHLFDESNF